MKSWHTINFYICSSFSDMHEEKAELIKNIFPLLQEHYYKQNLLLDIIDLNKQGNELDKFLTSYQNEIENCDFFISLIGEHYGYILKKVRLRFWKKRLNMQYSIN